jgi:ABC-type branched-subunit amino acid transport system ATPase component
MDSSVQLSTEELFLTDNSKVPLELAVLAGSMTVLLGDDETVAPDSALILAGKKPAISGTIHLGEDNLDNRSHSARGRIEYIPRDFSCPDGMTVSGYLSLAAAAAGYSRKNSADILSQLYTWCSLDKNADEDVNLLTQDKRYMTAFAAACLSVPDVLVLQGPFPEELHPLIEDLCQNGCAVIASLPGIQYIPQFTERIALCDSYDIRKIVRFQELSDACSVLMKLHVRFFPPLPRVVMESLPGAKDIVAIQGGFEFHHTGLSAAVTNLVNLARANSRQIAGLEVRPPSNSRLIDFFTTDDEPGEADLFWAENLDI